MCAAREALGPSIKSEESSKTMMPPSERNHRSQVAANHAVYVYREQISPKIWGELGRYGVGGAKPGSHEMRHAVLVYIRAELDKIQRIAVVRIGRSAIAMRPPRMLTELIDGVHNRGSTLFLYSERDAIDVAPRPTPTSITSHLPARASL